MMKKKGKWKRKNLKKKVMFELNLKISFTMVLRFKVNSQRSDKKTWFDEKMRFLQFFKTVIRRKKKRKMMKHFQDRTRWYFMTELTLSEMVSKSIQMRLIQQAMCKKDFKNSLSNWKIQLNLVDPLINLLKKSWMSLGCIQSE